MVGLGWLRGRRDGAIDRVPLPDGVDGSLWLSGKAAVAPDVERALARLGEPSTVVCLVEPRAIRRTPDYVEWLDLNDGHDAIWWPIRDFRAPGLVETEAMVEAIVERLRGGHNVLVHCGAGLGRTGMVAACVLIALGARADEALALVNEARPGAGPEVRSQRRLVEEFAARLAG